MRTRFALLVVVPLALIGADRRVIFPAGSKPVGPYSPGIFAGDFLYVSGQGARLPDGKFPPTPQEQVRQSLENVKSIIDAAGLTMEHIVYTQVYLHQSVSYDDLNKVWPSYFAKNSPARAVLGVHRMPTETPVEVSAVAVRELGMKKIVSSPVMPSGSVNSAGVIAGDRLYVSGMLGRDGATGKIPDSPAAQVQLSLDRVGAVLKAAGLDFRHLVFVNPYLTRQIPMNALNQVYAKYFEYGNTPARATIEVNHLAYGANIEFTGVAVMDLAKRLAVRPKNMGPSPTASPCVWGGDTLFCSAKSGFLTGMNGGIYADNVEDQVRMSMRNLLDGLEEAGINFSHVVSSNVYVDNLDEFAKMNAIYGRYFPPKSPPTRTTVAPLPPVDRARSASGHFPKLEEVSVIAVH
jgi:reactive intermediate/imine deaminase